MVTIWSIGANTSLRDLATLGASECPVERYRMAKARLFAQLYGAGDPTEAIAILHSLQKKAFGIWSPFQMEDFLHYPVMPDAEQKAKEFEEETAALQEVNEKLANFQRLGDRFLKERLGFNEDAAFGRFKRFFRRGEGTSKSDGSIQGTGMLPSSGGE